MHPDDVADFVAESVEQLRISVAKDPQLDVRAVELRDGTQLFVRFASETREAAEYASMFASIGGQQTAFARGVPILGTARREERVLHFDCTDWDGQPPRVQLLDEHERPVPDAEWPKDPDRRGIVFGHPQFGPGPFFCRPGTREFHTHPQHQDEPWDRFRAVMPLSQIVAELLRDLTWRWTLR